MKKYFAIIVAIILFTTMFQIIEDSTMIMEDRKWGYYTEYCKEFAKRINATHANYWTACSI